MNITTYKYYFIHSKAYSIKHNGNFHAQRIANVTILFYLTEKSKQHMFCANHLF